MAAIRTKPDILAGYVKREIEEMILSGNMKPGDYLEPELVLAQKMGVSRVTLREALRLLENDGIVVKKNGVGTYVSLPKHIISGRLEVDFSLSDSASAAGMNLQTVIAGALEREPTQREASKLKLKAGETVFCIQRLRYHDEQCIVLSFDVMPARIFRDKTVFDIGGRSLYSLLEEECACEITMGEAVLSASFATQEYAQIMDVEVGNPLMLVEQVDFNHAGNPVLFSREYYNSRIFKFKINRQRNMEQHALEYLSNGQKG